MSAAWLAHALGVGVLLAAAGAALERGLALAGRPTRWAWLGVMVGVVALVAISPLRPSGSAGTPAGVVVAPAPSGLEPQVEPEVGLAWAGAIASAFATIRGAFQSRLEAASRAASAVDGPGPRRAFLGLWLLASGALLALFALTVVRLRRARRSWPVARVGEEQVRIAPMDGPALMGIVRPEIVLPAWLLDADPDRVALVVRHEQEHARAGDHLLLAVGGVILVLLPWHPAVWWMHRRLRGAVEMDCDGRVLRRGAPKGAYGALLLDMAGRRVRLPLGASALAGVPTHLERRILAMTRKPPRHAAPGTAAFVGAASLLALLACGAELPTTTEVEAMDVAAVEATLTARGVYPAAGAVRYVVDGAKVAPEAARALSPERIARGEVRKSGEAEGTQLIQITTVDGVISPSGKLIEASSQDVPAIVAKDDGGVIVRARADTGEIRLAGPSSFDGLLIVNGEAVARDVLGRIRPGDIESIEVVKGAAATQAHDEPAARNGVIRITLKPGVTVR